MFLKKFCGYLEKNKIYKNSDKIKGKVWKTIEKILSKFKKKWLVFKYVCFNIEKNLSNFWENIM